jgi:uncharacterized lipoprotein YddW (UPF0748 family)
MFKRFRLPWVGLIAASFVLAFAGVGAHAAELIIDNENANNTDGAFTILSGNWSSRTSASDYLDDYRRTGTSSTVTADVEWRPTIPVPAAYEVAVWFVSATTRPNNAKYVVTHKDGTSTVTINQTQNGGQWLVIGTFNFDAGTAGRVYLSNQAEIGKTIAADAVRFRNVQPVDLTMAVSPPGTGVTVPPDGATYTQVSGDVVSIQAIPAEGYVFSHWEVSAGVGAASPVSPSTTVVVDQTKTVTAHFKPPTPELRAVWADAFHSGYKSQAQIDDLIARARAGRYNAIIAEVLAYHDNTGGGHGAYWNSAIVPRASDISGDIDPLAYLVQQAHLYGIEVHAWMVAFRISSSWPPSGNSIVAAHPEWLAVPSAKIGTVAPVDSVYVFDPGSPDVQNYLTSIVRELVTNYEIDGIHWDYIRYTQADAGYPADKSYANSGLERFKRIYGRTDVPPPAGDTDWNDFRRRTIDEVVGRVRAELPDMPSPRQPLRYTSALISWGNAPSEFAGSSAYGLFQNWEMWMRKGLLDGGCPMLYYREYNTSQYHWFRNWVDACLNWRHDRHMYLGQANYLNTMDDSIAQMLYEYGQGADGTVNYSYASTVDSNKDGVTENDWSWYDYVGANLFTSPAPLPPMPWRNPATATEGTLYGRVTGPDGQGIDNAAVQVEGLDPVQTDANGWYIVTLVPASGTGTAYTTTASAAGYPSFTASGVLVTAGLNTRKDFGFVAASPQPVAVANVGSLGAVADGTRVSLAGVKVTANPSQAGANYVQAADRSAGIRVESAAWFTPGSTVTVVGYLGTKPSGEKYLYDAGLVSDAPGAMPASMGAIAGNIGAVGLTGGNGAGNAGLLMRTWGTVTTAGSGFFTLNDGSLEGDGLKVDCSSAGNPPAAGSVVVVTGIVQLDGTAPDAAPLLRPRFAGDVEIR